MSHGMQVFGPGGQLTFDSNLAIGGVVVAVVRTPSAGVDVYNFPEYPGFSGDWAALVGYYDAGSPLVSVSNFPEGPSFAIHHSPFGPVDIVLLVQ